MNSEFNQGEEIEYLEYEGNCFLTDRGVLKDVRVETEIVRIPEEVKEIRRQAFLNARMEQKITCLVIPASVKKIERLTFAGMEGLLCVELLGEIVTLEPGTFRNCVRLEKIQLPATLRRIESRAFENCVALSEVILKTEQISVSEDAFLNCNKLHHKQIAEAIDREYRQRKSEEEDARAAKYPKFADMLPEEEQTPETEDLEQTNRNTEFCIRNGVLEHCEIGCSHIVIPKEVVKIGKNAFAGSASQELLERVDIPEGVERLEQRAFYGLQNLSEITFPSTLSYIGAGALEGTAWIKQKRKECSCVCVNGILISAFYDSMVLEAEIPKEVWRIAPYAFYRNEVRLVRIPDNVQIIDAYAFVEVGMTELELSNRAGLKVMHPIVARCHKLKEIYIPENQERIDEAFVEDCPSLQRVCIKGTRTVVHKRAFPENVKIWVI